MHPKTSRRVRATATGLGVLAVSLASALPAQAALGGAKTAPSDRRPNLVSVTVNGAQAVFGFDRTLESSDTPLAGGFGLMSNGQGFVQGQTATINGSAVRVGFANDLDLTKYTVGAVNGPTASGIGLAPSVVRSDNQALASHGNLMDSAPVTTSDSQDGTGRRPSGATPAPRRPDGPSRRRS